MNDDWLLWKSCPAKIVDSILFRYGLALVLTLLAALLTFRIPPLMEAPYILFIGASIFIALHAGLVAAFLSIGLSSLIIIRYFIPPYGSNLLDRQIYLDDSVRIVGFFLVSLTISALVAACRRERNALRESEERYRALVETASDGIIIVDEQGVVLFANSLAENIFSSPGRRMVGQKLASYLCESDYHHRLTEMQHHLDTRQRARPIELSGRDVNGKDIPLEITLGTFSTRDRNVVTAIIRDISQRKRAKDAAPSIYS